MPYNAEPGDVAYVTFSKACTHGDLVTEQGFVGVAVKQETPSQDTPRNQRNAIAVSEAGLLLISKVAEVPASAPIAAPAKGLMVYIKAADNTIHLAADALTGGVLNAGFLIVGRVCSLPGERGTPSNIVRINLRQKV
jgi:hypothetical protein